MESVARSPTPTAAKGSGHKVHYDLLHYHEGLHCLEMLDDSSAVYDADCTAGMICGMQHRQCIPHEQDDTLQYLRCHMPN